jgi:hypothetical protein
MVLRKGSVVETPWTRRLDCVFRIVADYMMWKIIEETWQYLSQPVREVFERYYEEAERREPQLDRRKFCISESRKQ